MVSEIFESPFWIGQGFIPKSNLAESFSNNIHEEKDVKETEKHRIKSQTAIIFMRNLLGLRTKEKNRICKL
jgi:hypothetical protein